LGGGCGQPLGKEPRAGHDRRVPPHLSLAARELLSAQRGLIADWQAPAAGLTAQRMRRACDSGWARVSQHVFSDRTGEIDIAQGRTAAVLECGPGSALTARAALREAGRRARHPRVPPAR
jgi:hypothetical protein